MPPRNDGRLIDTRKPMHQKQPAIYIMANKIHTVLYTGFTSDLIGRTYKHKENFYDNSFTAKYQVKKLVYYELFGTMPEAIAREKQIKAGSRKKKIELIEKMNPEWKDLWEEII